MRSAPRHSASAYVAVIAAALLALFFLTPTAQAHHTGDHPNGAPEGGGPPPAAESGGPSTAAAAGGPVTGGVSEDNDSDGTPNTSDPAGDADNQHPSGKDKHADNGVTGHSTSDPDGDSNGGADKPGGTGGVDQLDQDGNNGCGNDDDFEDDNKGNCGGNKQGGGQPAPVSIQSGSGEDSTTVLSSLAAADHEIFSSSVASASETLSAVTTDAGQLAAADDASVLGVQVSSVGRSGETARSASVATSDDNDESVGFIGELARTGLSMGVLAAAGLAFIAAAKALLDRTNRLGART